MGNMRASVCREAIINGVLVLRDLNVGTMTITNDAESVVRWACTSITGWNTSMPIVYRDTDGRFDALAHRNGEFTDFVLLGAQNPQHAARQILEAYGH
jgi:hypothetical protein